MAHTVKIEPAIEPAFQPAAALPIVRCPHCGHRLFDGYLVGRIKCPRGRCGKLLEFVARKDDCEYSMAKS